MREDVSQLSVNCRSLTGSIQYSNEMFLHPEMLWSVLPGDDQGASEEFLACAVRDCCEHCLVAGRTHYIHAHLSFR